MNSEPTRLPFPSFASSIASSTDAYGITVFTGPNASTSCGSRRVERRVVVEQRRREERALAPDPRRRRRSRRGSPNTSSVAARDRVDALRAPRAPAPRRRAGPCARPRRPDRRPSRRRAASRARAITSSTIAVGHERAADRGALLPRLRRHLAHDFLHEQIELLACPAPRRGRASSS